jgi:hypothetical protein
MDAQHVKSMSAREKSGGREEVGERRGMGDDDHPFGRNPGLR